jgi:hypothetical protein
MILFLSQSTYINYRDRRDTKYSCIRLTLIYMRSILTVLAVLISSGSAVAVRADVTNISTQQKATVVGNNITTIDSKTIGVRNGKTFTKSHSSTHGLKRRVKG